MATTASSSRGPPPEQVPVLYAAKAKTVFVVAKNYNLPIPGSRATSIKVEPGSALESNASASVKDKLLLSPSYNPGAVSATSQ